MRVGIPVADLCAGMFAAQGTMLALLEREVSGKGQWVQTSLLEAQIQMLDFQAARFLKDGEIPVSAGNDHPTNIPTGVFPTADGHINIAAPSNRMFRTFCKAIGAEALPDRPEYADAAQRSRNRDALNAEINEYTSRRNADEWIALLNDAGIPCGPINTIDQTFADPQVQHLGIAIPMDSPSIGATQVVGQAVNLSRTPSPDHVLRPTPELGEHTEEILGPLGYDADRVAALREAGVV